MEDHERPTSPSPSPSPSASTNGASSDDRLPPLASTMFKSSWDNASIRASSIKEKEKEKDRKKSFSLPRAGHFPILGEKHLITVMGAKTVIPSKERKNNALIGHVAPEFRLKDQKERWTSLHTTLTLGRPVIVFFFPLAGTPHCTTESCMFRDALMATPVFHQTRAIVIGISQDPPARSSRFVQEHKLTYRVLYDEGRRVMNRWGVSKAMLGLADSRCTFVVDPSGVVRGMAEGVFDSAGHIKYAERWLTRIEHELSSRKRHEQWIPLGEIPGQGDVAAKRASKTIRENLDADPSNPSPADVGWEGADTPLIPPPEWRAAERRRRRDSGDLDVDEEQEDAILPRDDAEAARRDLGAEDPLVSASTGSRIVSSSGLKHLKILYGPPGSVLAGGIGDAPRYGAMPATAKPSVELNGRSLGEAFGTSSDLSRYMSPPDQVAEAVAPPSQAEEEQEQLLTHIDAHGEDNVLAAIDSTSDLTRSESSSVAVYRPISRGGSSFIPSNQYKPRQPKPSPSAAPERPPIARNKSESESISSLNSMGAFGFKHFISQLSSADNEPPPLASLFKLSRPGASEPLAAGEEPSVASPATGTFSSRFRKQKQSSQASEAVEEEAAQGKTASSSASIRSKSSTRNKLKSAAAAMLAARKPRARGDAPAIPPTYANIDTQEEEFGEIDDAVSVYDSASTTRDGASSVVHDPDSSWTHHSPAGATSRSSDTGHTRSLRSRRSSARLQNEVVMKKQEERFGTQDVVPPLPVGWTKTESASSSPSPHLRSTGVGSQIPLGGGMTPTSSSGRRLVDALSSPRTPARESTESPSSFETAADIAGPAVGSPAAPPSANGAISPTSRSIPARGMQLSDPPRSSDAASRNEKAAPKGAAALVAASTSSDSPLTSAMMRSISSQQPKPPASRTSLRRTPAKRRTLDLSNGRPAPADVPQDEAADDAGSTASRRSTIEDDADESEEYIRVNEDGKVDLVGPKEPHASRPTTPQGQAPPPAFGSSKMSPGSSITGGPGMFGGLVEELDNAGPQEVARSKTKATGGFNNPLTAALQAASESAQNRRRSSALAGQQKRTAQQEAQSEDTDSTSHKRNDSASSAGTEHGTPPIPQRASSRPASRDSTSDGALASDAQQRQMISPLFGRMLEEQSRASPPGVKKNVMRQQHAPHRRIPTGSTDSSSEAAWTSFGGAASTASDGGGFKTPLDHTPTGTPSHSRRPSQSQSQSPSLSGTPQLIAKSSLWSTGSNTRQRSPPSIPPPPPPPPPPLSSSGSEANAKEERAAAAATGWASHPFASVLGSSNQSEASSKDSAMRHSTSDRGAPSTKSASPMDRPESFLDASDDDESWQESEDGVGELSSLKAGKHSRNGSATSMQKHTRDSNALASPEDRRPSVASIQSSGTFGAP